MNVSSDYKRSIEKNFSKHAHLYDEYADIQYAAASGLIKEAPSGNIRKILEIGCGTGNYTRLLRERLNEARIMALDKSKNMVEIAKKKLEGERVEFIVADAEELELDEKFDLITSNAAFQWFSDLERAVEKYRDSLDKKGMLLFSTFGPMTFSELEYSLKKVLGQSVSIDAAHFPEKEEIKVILGRYFKESVIREEIRKETFHSLTGLLNKIRCTGERGNAPGNLFLWKRNIINNVEKMYKDGFGDIEVSYQIFFCKAVI